MMPGPGQWAFQVWSTVTTGTGGRGNCFACQARICQWRVTSHWLAIFKFSSCPGPGRRSTRTPNRTEPEREFNFSVVT